MAVRATAEILRTCPRHGPVTLVDVGSPPGDPEGALFACPRHPKAWPGTGCTFRVVFHSQRQRQRSVKPAAR